jgi:preprotein translocase subunit SecD
VAVVRAVVHALVRIGASSITAAPLVSCAVACSAPGSDAASESTANQGAGRIAFGIVADARTPAGAPQRTFAHWDAGGAWNVPAHPIWALEEPLLQCRVEQAVQTVDDLGFAAVELRLDPRDVPAFRTLGERASGRRLAVLVDGRVVVTPRVEQPFAASFQLAGNFSKRDVELLLEHLRPSARGTR